MANRIESYDYDVSSNNFVFNQSIEVLSCTKGNIYGISQSGRQTSTILLYGEYGCAVTDTKFSKDFYFNDWVLNAKMIGDDKVVDPVFLN